MGLPAPYIIQYTEKREKQERRFLEFLPDFLPNRLNFVSFGFKSIFIV
jgi:hypothetical protein